MAKKSVKIFGRPKIKPRLPQVRQIRTNPSEIRERIARLKMAQARQEVQISPNTLAMLQKLRMIQNKGKFDDMNMQRIQREKRMLADAGNLLKTPNMFGPDSNKLNILDMDDNILNAPNQFMEVEGNRILNTNRPSLLNTKEVGNNLSFGYIQ